VERYQYDAYGDVVIQETLSADVDYDGTVAPAHAGLVMFYYGSDPCSEVEPWLYDVNFDGTIDSVDKGLVKFHYGSAFKQHDHSTVWNPYFFTGRRVGMVQVAGIADGIT
jgi:hypothetical protein